MPGALFMNFTATYNTVRHRGFTCKLLCLLPDRHKVSLIMELVRNCSFTLTICTGSQSKLRRPKNGVSQGSVLAPLLFNIYTHGLTVTISRKFFYTDDIAIMHLTSNWKTLEETLSQDLTTITLYLQKWKLKLSTAKTVLAAFHLNSKEIRRKLYITVEV